MCEQCKEDLMRKQAALKEFLLKRAGAPDTTTLKFGITGERAFELMVAHIPQFMNIDHNLPVDSSIWSEAVDKLPSNERMFIISTLYQELATANGKANDYMDKLNMLMEILKARGGMIAVSKEAVQQAAQEILAQQMEAAQEIEQEYQANKEKGKKEQEKYIR